MSHTPRYPAINLLLIFALMLLSQHALTAKTRVACVGNSITYGYGLADPSTESYPARLQVMLGDEYEVGNFGRSGATLLRQGHRPYNEQPEYRAAIDFKADIAVIHLGVNDTDPRNWPVYGDRFISDYVSLIDSLRATNPDIRIIIAQLTPIGASHYRFRSGTRQWLREIRPAIRKVAEATGAEVIDFDRPLRYRQNLMPDAIHPDAEGALLLAETVRGAITGDYGGLSLPEIYQNGMVMQRDRYLPLSGTADAGENIIVTIAGQTHHATANNRGEWSVTLRPLTAGGPYELTVSDSRQKLRFTDILAGEVWLASGQSNMEFPLFSDAEADASIASSTDDKLRFYNMKPIAGTNPRQWPDSIIAATNRLEHFRPAHWAATKPENAGNLSAVAYYFARQLRDSLRVPVGVISNAIGGSPCESWIDVTMLEDNMPEILLNWRGNDYLQPWTQQRANENTGTQHKNARHPYEPGYLFAAGILPLGHYPVKGMIWYQGESNAHNTMLHEQLFPMLVESMRSYFGDSRMPVVYAQLSSIDRQSWPMFRDSQRRLEQTIDRVYMAVTSDVGDSLDVHPRFKRPVGERMSRQALHNIYGFESLTPCGPQPISVRRLDNNLIITFDNADRLATSDGRKPATFEIASVDGLYLPADAVIINENEIKVCNMDIKRPRYVRYGWQPFTRANLINADGLPASTFRMSADDADTEHESGIECGVSAPFAGMIDGRIIMAGGCNFPTDPLAPGAQKKFYRGIYSADPATMQWQRIGTLPQPTAYGASVTIPEGIIMIGGTPEGKPTDEVSLLSIIGGNPEITPLPSLPATLDNLAASAIGHKIYVAGGNLDGVPSSAIFMLDMDNLTNGWTALRRMPGNPRMQPVMTTGESSDGEMCLYLWGGFAPRHNGKEPSLELNGLRFSPSKNKWVSVECPTDAEGMPLSVGGGTACTLSDGCIAVAGGVNKDVFLEALRNQAPDYLRHPAEWYRFNPNILIFNPTTEQWSVEVTTQQAARAGAAMVAGTNHDLYILGGEIKPRIRTAETFYLNEIRHH